MIYKQNLHTHTIYVDGKDTPEAMILEAINKDFDSLGFSEHSYVEFSKFEPQLRFSDFQRYINEINDLKEKYKDKIKIFCGLEMEFYSSMPTDGLDYIIASAHYVQIGENYYPVDGSVEEMIALNKKFGNDSLKFAKKYFETISLLPERHKADILGHFDLLSKNTERLNYLDVNSKEYLKLGFESINSLKGKIPLFEVNTGAVSRGYRTSPYPQLEFIKEFKNCGFGAVITSDCHNKNHLDCDFDNAKELLEMAGYNSRYVLTDSGFKEIAL